MTVLVDCYDDEDWTLLWWVRISGRARVLDQGEEAARALSGADGRKYPQYRDDPPSPPVLAVDVGDWRTWSLRLSTYCWRESRDLS